MPPRDPWLVPFEPLPNGLVICDACRQPAAPRGGHLSVHFPDRKTTRPCERSWPPRRGKS